MAKNPIRRAQLISPFGVGAMMVIRGGIGLITAGLDHWYKREDNLESVDISEYKIEEWRLQQSLGVDHFRLPPDYRGKQSHGKNAPNTGLTVPFLRFPQWHFCPWCHRLEERPLSERTTPRCPECQKQSYMFQVPFVAVCEAGHIQDFPWREWVHKTPNSTCKGVLRLRATGSASLSGQRVECECGIAPRSLASITNANPDGTTFLSKNLAQDDSIFYCRGQRTWLGDGTEEECGFHLRGALRSASNVYFAQIRSAIYLPRGDSFVPQELILLLEQAPLSTLITTLLSLLSGIDNNSKEKLLLDGLRKQHLLLLEPFTDKQILHAIDKVFNFSKEPTQAQILDIEDQETTFRRDEFSVLRKPRDENVLSIREGCVNDYDKTITKYFSKVMLIDKLRETRVLTGFTRIYAENDQSLEHRKTMLRKEMNSESNWLPAYTVFGEGIYFELDEGYLQEWEQQDAVGKRIKRLEETYEIIQQKRKLRQQPIIPRFVLLHTLAHLLMNRLTFECGYSSAALRERLYVSNTLTSPMAGLLIYTADGDAEGTMGGLVRMGKPGNLEPVLRRALQNAAWCSTDPVCMEIGGRGGQGPDSCNLAACHNCALVPETACEHFNRFLDRAVVIGELGNPNIGYFKLGEL